VGTAEINFRAVIRQENSHVELSVIVNASLQLWARLGFAELQEF
jgi:hypothetical protein